MLSVCDWDELEIVEKIVDVKDYSTAKGIIRKLNQRLTQLKLHRSRFTEQEYQDKEQEMNDSLNRQESIIQQYIDNQPEMSNKYFGANVKFLLEKYDLKVVDLEKVLGISTGYISRTLDDSSKKRLSIDVMWQISELFSISIDTLINVDLNELSPDVQPVFDFIDKLKIETDEKKIRWKNQGNEYKMALDILFTDTYDFEGSIIKEYGPKGYENSRCYEIYNDIYTSEIMHNDIYLVQIRDNKNCRYGVEIYVYERHEDYGELNRICCTLDDKTDNLTAKATELINVIKLRENDFVVSASAKRFISDYLKMDSDE